MGSTSPTKESPVTPVPRDIFGESFRLFPSTGRNLGSRSPTPISLPTLLVDADSLIWKAALCSINTWDGVEITSLSQAMRSFDGRLREVTRHLPTHEVLLCYSSATNFRKHENPSYKANRPKAHPFIGQVRERIQRIYGGLWWPDLEGDDVVGMCHIPGGDTVVYSEDKDLMQLEGDHLSPEGFIISQSHYDAMLFFYTQVLTGDSTDGYPGCPGIGEKRAADALLGTPVEDMWDAVLMVYEKNGLSETDALTQAHMAWICRSPHGRWVPPKRKYPPLDWSKLNVTKAPRITL